MVAVLGLGEIETSLSVGHPDAQFVAAERVEHDAIVLGDRDREEGALKLLRVVVAEMGLVLMLRVDEVEFRHQLATVADAQRERILARIEAVERLLGLGIVEEGTRPSLGRSQDVGVGESATEDDHIDLLQGLATTNEVGHHHVLHLEACEVEGVGHLALAIGALLTDDSRLGRSLTVGIGRGLPAVGIEAILGERSREVGVELHLHGLLLVVGVALLRHAVEALVAVEEIGGLVPDVAQAVDI